MNSAGEDNFINQGGHYVKKPNKVRLLAAIVLSIAIAVPTIMYAAQQQMFRHKRCVSHWDLFQLKRDLNITDQQASDLKAIGMQTAASIQPLIQQMRDLRKLMRETLLSPEIDTVQYESQISEIIGLRSQMADIFLRAKLQEAQVLTPDQRATLLEFTGQLEQCLEDEDQFPSLFPDLLN